MKTAPVIYNVCSLSAEALSCNIDTIATMDNIIVNVTSFTTKRVFLPNFLAKAPVNKQPTTKESPPTRTKILVWD